jgi:transposase-like protein
VVLFDHIAARGELRAAVRGLARHSGVNEVTAARWRNRWIEQSIVTIDLASS